MGTDHSFNLVGGHLGDTLFIQLATHRPARRFLAVV